jgi:outer membrane protein assembly factor BamB
MPPIVRQFLLFIAVVLSLAASSAVTLGQPVVTATPQAGPPSSNVTASGTGFGASEAVDLYFDTSELALATTTPGGAFTGVRLRVPASATPGTHPITAVGQDSGLAAQTQFIVQTDWPGFHRGPQHHGYNPTENVLSVSSVGGLQLRWKAATGGYVNSSPAIANGMVFTGSDDTTLYAFNAETGQLIWSAAGACGASSPVVVDGVVYSGSYGLHAFNAVTGRPLWDAAPDYTIVASPTVANGIVYAGDVDYNGFGAFDAATGQQIWSVLDNPNTQIWSSPAVSGGLVYVSDGQFLYAYDATTGKLIWTAAAGGEIFSSPAVENGVVFVGSGAGLHAINAATGDPLWTAAARENIESSPAVADGVVYVGSFSSNALYAFNAATGETLWTASTGNLIYSSPAVANGVVYVGSYDGKIYAFNVANGQLLWSAETGSNVASSPAVANGMVYVGSYDNNLYAFGLTGSRSFDEALPAREKKRQ